LDVGVTPVDGIWIGNVCKVAIAVDKAMITIDGAGKIDPCDLTCSIDRRSCCPARARIGIVKVRKAPVIIGKAVKRLSRIVEIISGYLIRGIDCEDEGAAASRIRIVDFGKAAVGIYVPVRGTTIIEIKSRDCAGLADTLDIGPLSASIGVADIGVIAIAIINPCAVPPLST
jgi:hypothetical protein